MNKSLISKYLEEFREKFGDLAPMIDAATHTGASGVGTPFSDIYIRDLEKFVTEKMSALAQEVREKDIEAVGKVITWSSIWKGVEGMEEVEEADPNPSDAFQQGGFRAAAMIKKTLESLN